MDFTDDDVASLADKLAAMDLSEGEREALRTMAALSTASTAGDAEVTGFGRTAAGLGGGAPTFAALALRIGPPTGAPSTMQTRSGIIIDFDDD